MAYSPPATAKPFTLDISDSDFADFKTLLKASKLGPDTWEGRQEDRRFGTTRQWLSDAKDYWLNKYDWRAQEKRINSFPQYTMQIEDITVHFVALFSERKDAVPIMFMHGWPGSFIEFLPMCELIKKQYSSKDLPYHIIVPSLPGYTLSSGGPVDRDWTLSDSARILDRLMQNLGFPRYIAQGGDVGCFLTHILVNNYNGCQAGHFNMFLVGALPKDLELSPLEKVAIDRARAWRESGNSYALLHGTRPSTIGLILSSNPLALLAWIGEKMLEWSDTDPSLDTILTNVSLYWFTESFSRSIYPYRWGNRAALTGYIEKPFGFSFFPKEISPGIKALLEKQGNLVQYTQHEHGGHFAALEHPQELWEDVESFVKKICKV